MRAIWKGAISFGLVNIPVALYSASSKTDRVKFRLLRSSDQSPIKYKRVAEADEKEVPWNEIAKGYEFERGRFVLLTDKDFERVALKSNQIIEIKEFVNLDEIDPMFFDAPYYLAPDKGGERAYALLRDALAKKNKVGISKVVLRTREHLAAVKPVGNTLVLALMHFADELADPGLLPLPDSAASKKEMEMAISLIDHMTDEWQPEKYHDEYAQAVRQVVDEKLAAGGKELPAARHKTAPATNVVDIVSMLQQSLSQAKKSEPNKKTRRRA
jgi:DNA end-binding protein Ku